jgi:hypothetical protein
LTPDAVHVRAASGGRNSRTYRVDAGGVSYALKVYPEDSRDRWGAERAALQLFERHGVACVPRWLGGDGDVAFLEWIEGAPVGEPDERDVDALAAFIAQVRDLGAHGAALGPASEACLSGDELLRQLDTRLERLRAEGERRAFASERLAPLRASAEVAAREAYRRAGLSFAALLPPERRCLIPADLGFHNALRPVGRAARLVFLDFEYMGWDDPVKLVADVVLHPGHALSEVHAARLLAHLTRIFDGDPTFTARLEALRPLFALRWALIVLARPGEGQLARAEALLR